MHYSHQIQEETIQHLNKCQKELIKISQETKAENLTIHALITSEFEIWIEKRHV